MTEFEPKGNNMSSLHKKNFEAEETSDAAPNPVLSEDPVTLLQDAYFDALGKKIFSEDEMVQEAERWTIETIERGQEARGVQDDLEEVPKAQSYTRQQILEKAGLKGTLPERMHLQRLLKEFGVDPARLIMTESERSIIVSRLNPVHLPNENEKRKKAK